MHSIDLSIVTVLNSWTVHHRIVQVLSIFFAAYSQYVLGAVALYLIARSKKDRIKNIFIVGIATVAAGIARLVIKNIIVHVYPYPRPFVALPAIHAFIVSVGEDYQSFPSGHALFFFAFAAIIGHYDKKWGWFFYSVAILMGIARVCVGVHYPSDIIVGAVIGILTAKAVLIFIQKFISFKDKRFNTVPYAKE